MFRYVIYIVLVLSLGCNFYCGFDYYKSLKAQQFGIAFMKSSQIKNITIKEGDNFLFEKIKKMPSKKLKNKKYYFISIWNTLCRPCIKEMPLLDTLADNIKRKDIGYIFLTENSEKLISQYREKHKINPRNFDFINDADIYISSILKSNNLKNRVYPIQLIIDKNGSVKYFQTGTFESSKDSSVISCTKQLPL